MFSSCHHLWCGFVWVSRVSAVSDVTLWYKFCKHECSLFSNFLSTQPSFKTWRIFRQAFFVLFNQSAEAVT